MNLVFFSIDKLVQFGISTNVARQMVHNMNYYLKEMYSPGTNKNQSDNCPKYFIVLDENIAGPYSEEELINLIVNNLVNSETLVWTNGMKGWGKFKDIPNLVKLISLNQPVLKEKQK